MRVRDHPNYTHFVLSVASHQNIAKAIGSARQEAAVESTGDAHKIPF